MIDKAWKIAKEVAIGVLLIIGLWLLLTALVKKENIESLSDWISSISTLGTLLVALFAYRAAPKWISQKIGETALLNASQVLTVDIPQLRKIISPYYYRIYNFLELYESMVDNQSKNYIIINFIEEYSLEKLDSLKLTDSANEIQDRLNALRKMGWELTDVAERYYTKLEVTVHALLMSLSKLNQMIDVHNTLCQEGKFENAKKFHKAIIHHSTNLRSNIESFNESYTLFNQYKNHVPDYFIQKIK